MRVTLLETFDRKYKLITSPTEEPKVFETEEALADFMIEKGIHSAEIRFLRRPVPDPAIICHTPATEWTEADYNFNWWRKPPSNWVRRKRFENKRNTNKD
jgi:hypothetical protein